MKKLSLKIICLSLILILLIGSMASCSGALLLPLLKEERRATAIYNAVNQLPLNTTSYTVDSTIDAVFHSSSAINLTLEATTTQKMIDINRDSFIHRNRSTYTLKRGSLTTVSNTVTEQGFENGKMYIATGDESKMDNKFYSELSADAYFKHIENNLGESNLKIDTDTCNTMSAVKEEDKSWTATYSGFHDEGLEQFEELVEDFVDLLSDDYKIADVSLVVKVDKKLSPLSLSMEYIFEKTNESSKVPSPELKITTTIKDINNTSPDEAIDFSKAEWKCVDDLRAVDYYLMGISKIVTNEQASFTSKIETNVISGSSSQKVTVDYTGNLSNTTEGLTCEFSQKQTNSIESLQYQYSNGQLTTITQKGTGTPKETTKDCSESQMFATIRSIIDPAMLQITDVKDIRTIDAKEGIYEIMLNDSNSVLSQLIGSLGTLTTSSGVLRFTYKDGYLTQCTLDIDIYSTATRTMLTVVVTNTYSYNAE